MTESFDTPDTPAKPQDFAGLRTELATLVHDFSPRMNELRPRLEDHKYRWELHGYGLPDRYDKHPSSQRSSRSAGTLATGRLCRSPLLSCKCIGRRTDSYGDLRDEGVLARTSSRGEVIRVSVPGKLRVAAGEPGWRRPEKALRCHSDSDWTLATRVATTFYFRGECGGIVIPQRPSSPAGCGWTRHCYVA